MRSRPSERGISLPELLVVLGIIGMFAMVAIPSFRDFLQAFKVRTAANQVVGVFRLSRQVAVARKGPVVIEIYGTEERYDAAVDANRNNSVDDGEEKIRAIAPLQKGVDLVYVKSGATTWDDADFTLASNGTINRVGCGSGCNETEWQVLLSRVINSRRKDEWTITVTRAGKVKSEVRKVAP